ncbi:hypothetical protein HYFRA_00010062 [Hymenoscyphus fraxineus]|uniref:Uncharacterized protein n=1 Tax=Hymenoscyphus fraxineus TaxID=746836 RepID=A0A9N9PSN6_9HELO|nr:hypothetical protein HYFRA_00010062 [Hymenoscyphus fraxineus]
MKLFGLVQVVLALSLASVGAAQSCTSTCAAACEPLGKKAKFPESKCNPASSSKNCVKMREDGLEDFMVESCG